MPCSIVGRLDSRGAGLLEGPFAFLFHAVFQGCQSFPFQALGELLVPEIGLDWADL